jgi:hypothetical protein
MARLIGDYECASLAFNTAGPVEERAEAVKAAKFRLEAYAAYLDEQRQKLQTETDRITSELLIRIKATT